MQVNEVMSSDVNIASPQQTIREAARMMAKIDAGVLPVGENDRLVGMITDRDIAVRGVAKGHGPDTPVSELMTNDVVCARDTDDVADVASKMSSAQVRRMPIVDSSDRICGIVSLGDLSREADSEAADQALQGVSAPGSQHSQG